MTGGHPRTAIGTYGTVYVMRNGHRCVAETRVRDLDGRLRHQTDRALPQLLRLLRGTCHELHPSNE